MATAYRNVLRRGDVLSALVPYVLARLPLSMAPLALLLLAQEQSGSYHSAGVVCAAYAVAVAVSSPVLGRLVDRHGQSRVLLIAGLVHTAAMISAAVAAVHHRLGLLTVAALVAGGSLPPVTACMRVLWTKLLPDAAGRKAGFAIDGVIVEVAELSGPLLVSLLLIVGRPATAVATSGVLMGIGSIAFRSSKGSRSVRAGDVRRNIWGALAVPGVRRLLAIVASSTATIGAVEVTMTAFARHHGGISSAGLYIGVISVGGIVAGVLFGGSEQFGHRKPATVLTTVLLMAAASAASMTEAPGALVMSGTLFMFGAAVAVGVIVQLSTMSAIVTDDIRTEAFTWGATANFVGLGLGTAATGWMIDRYGLHAAYLVAAAPTVLAAALTVMSRRAFAAADSAEADAVVVDADLVVEVDEPGPDEPLIALAPELDVASLAAEVADLQLHVHDLEVALAAALESSETSIDGARERARRMLDRADAACLEMRDRAEADAERVRSAATTASLEILAAAQRDAKAMLERARRDAEAIMARTRQIPAQETPVRPTLHALPGVDEAAPADEAAASS